MRGERVEQFCLSENGTVGMENKSLSLVREMG